MPLGLVFIWWVLRQEPLIQGLPPPWAMLRSQAVNAMLRPRYHRAYVAANPADSSSLRLG